MSKNQFTVIGSLVFAAILVVIFTLRNYQTFEVEGFKTPSITNSTTNIMFGLSSDSNVVQTENQLGSRVNRGELYNGAYVPNCYFYPDISDHPDFHGPDRQSVLDWRKEFPFTVMTPERIRESRDNDSIKNWNLMSKEKEREDRANGNRLDSWNYLRELRDKLDNLKPGLKVSQVCEVFGDPTTVYTYYVSFTESGQNVYIERNISDLTLETIVSNNVPFSIRYAPPDRDDIRGQPFRVLWLDFRRGNTLVQWYMSPVPLTSDW